MSTDRDEHPLTRKYREYAAICEAWHDAPLPEGHGQHAGWLLSRALEQRRARGYTLYELDFLAREGELLSDAEFEQALAAGEPIPYDLRETE